MGAANDVADQAARPRTPEPGEVLADKYRVERVVGVGGMGVVLAAQHLQLGQSVAIKLLSTEETRRSEATARFQREGRAAAGLRSDHVVRIYDVGTLADGSPFMVMELLRGIDLATLIDQEGPLPVPHAVEYVLQACDAIAEAHDLGIVHRDLKPSNLFVTRRSDGTALLKVLDFGISKAIRPEAEGVDGSLTQTRSLMGSPYYMSPEQVRDAKKVDARTDIWALGVILHELLTATPAFQADTFPGICAAIVADEPADVRALRPDVPEELVAVIRRCLEKDPRRRYETVAELVEALRPFAPRAAATLPTLPAPRVSLPAASVNSEAATVVQDAVVSAPRLASSQAGVATSRPAAPAAAESRKLGVALLVALALALGGALSLILLKSADAPPSMPAEARRTSFKLTVESTPPGAEVFESGRLIGATPLQLAIDRSSVANRPRSFVVRLTGYLPYSLEQSDSQEDVRFVAALVPEPPVVEPAPPASVSAAPEPAAPAVRRPARPSKPAAAKPAPVEAPPAQSPDIRMQR